MRVDRIAKHRLRWKAPNEQQRICEKLSMKLPQTLQPLGAIIFQNYLQTDFSKVFVGQWDGSDTECKSTRSTGQAFLIGRWIKNALQKLLLQTDHDIYAEQCSITCIQVLHWFASLASKMTEGWLGPRAHLIEILLKTCYVFPLKQKHVTSSWS